MKKLLLTVVLALTMGNIARAGDFTSDLNQMGRDFMSGSVSNLVFLPGGSYISRDVMQNAAQVGADASVGGQIGRAHV